MKLILRYEIYIPAAVADYREKRYAIYEGIVS